MAGKRVLLLLSPQTYRAGAFMEAAARLDLRVDTAVDMPESLASHWNAPFGIDFSRVEAAAAAIVERAAHTPFDAIIAVDDSAALVAATASSRLGLEHNPPEAALAARDKARMRELLAAGGALTPAFQQVPLDADPASIAGDLAYPCVVKPLRLSGSRGVIRADNAAELIAAFRRVRAMLEKDGYDVARTGLLVEEFIPGVEVAVEGLMTGGELQVLAIFDKPDPLDGPFFEEAIYVTPSRLPPATQHAIAASTRQAARALGLRTGPVHAELRVNERGAWPVELAGRSIGGHCSTILQFGAGMSLEELILRHAAGDSIPELGREAGAAGVMMIPIPGAGILAAVEGVDEARRGRHITGVEISARLGAPLVPLPEGASYLGFIFARAGEPATVEDALRAAHAKLRFRIRAELPVLPLSGVAVGLHTPTP